MRFKAKPTDAEIEAIRCDGEIVYHYESKSGLGNYEAFLILPDSQIQEHILKSIGSDNFLAAVESTKDEVVLWANTLTMKSVAGLVGAYSDFFQKLSPENLKQA